MLTLNDGRTELWQWDTGRTLTVGADCSQVHFSNKVFGRSIDVNVVDGVAIIPDILLQTDKDLTAWAFVGTSENGYTKISRVFKVNRRNKPADYVFTPPEQTSLEEIKEKIDYLESIQDPDAIKNAVEDYLDQNPVESPVQSDWNQTDETAADFIKNKPFGETPTVLYEGTDLAPMDEDGAYLLELPTLEFAEGAQYTVVIDGEEYTTEGTYLVGFIVIGNPAQFGGADNGLPFVCMQNTDTGEGTLFASFISFTSLRIVESSIKKIEQKYLPTSLIVLEKYFEDADNARYLYKTQSGDKSDRVTLNELRAFVKTGRPIYLNINGMWHQPTLISVYEPRPYGYVEIMMKNGEQREYYTAEYTAE